MAMSIEPASGVERRVCSDCGRPFSSVHGFVYEDGNACAVYHALLQTHQPSTVADLALSFGSWDEEATAADRMRVGVRVWPEQDDVMMHINDPGESSWGDSETLGKLAGRSEVLGTPLERQALQTVEFLIVHDPRIAEHLR
ncbi:MAG TPA: hypothetical protein VKC62_06320 [Gaiellaceae bacterium]|nr:hypothetical protein [Gaiellaceae bacterium]